MGMYKRNISTQDFDTITLADALSQNAPKPKKVCLFSSMQLNKIKPEIFWSSIFIHYISKLNAISKGLSPHYIVPRPHGNYLFFCSHFDERRFLSKLLFRQFGSQKNNEFSRKEVSTYIRAKAINEAKLWRYLKPQNI